MKGAQEIFSIIIAAIISLLILIIAFNVLTKAKTTKLNEKDSESIENICKKFGVDVKTGNIEPIEKVYVKDAIKFTEIFSKLCKNVVNLKTVAIKCQNDPSLEDCVAYENKVYILASNENIVKAINICSAYARANSLCIDECGYANRFICLKNIDKDKSWCNGDFLISIEGCCGKTCNIVYGGEENEEGSE